jgi:hypothetical protein
MTLYEFCEAVARRGYTHPEERIGQASFNVLVESRPDLSELIRTTDLDPFYNDDVLPEFYDWLFVNWDKEIKS